MADIKIPEEQKQKLRGALLDLWEFSEKIQENKIAQEEFQLFMKRINLRLEYFEKRAGLLKQD